MQNNGLKFMFVLIGSAVLIGLSALICGVAVVGSFSVNVAMGCVMALVAIGLLYQYFDEIKSIMKIDRSTVSWGVPDLAIFAAVVIGAVATFVISVELKQGAVVASALIGIIAALVAPKYAVPAYCGSFVGMVSASLASNYGFLMLAAVVAGGVFLMAKLVFNGFGGKLGTIAFSGCLAMIYLTGQSTVSANFILGTNALIILAAAIVGTVATYYISVRLNHGPVMASGIVGLIGGLVLPQLFPELGALPALFFSASFAGMSGKVRFESEAAMVLVGAIVGAIFIFSMPYGGGAGGKLGTIAFASAMAGSGLIKLFRLVVKKQAA
jgi:hypothetical protein